MCKLFLFGYNNTIKSQFSQHISRFSGIRLACYPLVDVIFFGKSADWGRDWMKAAFYLWKRRLLWVVLLSVLLAAAMGVYAYRFLPVRYEATAEVLMLKEGGESLSALAEEAVRWSAYDA